jgi:hypothetical protein
MAERKDVEKPRPLLTIDPKQLYDNACVVQTSSAGDEWAICVEGKKIKIFPVIKHVRQKT